MFHFIFSLSVNKLQLNMEETDDYSIDDCPVMAESLNLFEELFHTQSPMDSLLPMGTLVDDIIDSVKTGSRLSGMFPSETYF